MSIYYSFEVASDLDPAAIGRQLGLVAGHLLPNPSGSGEPAFVAVRPREPDPIDDEAYAGAYGFAPRVGIVVELDKFEAGVQAREAPAMHVLRTLLETTRADMYVSHLGDHPVLVRRQGAITIDPRWLTQRPWFPALLPLPYTAARLVDPYAEPAA